LVFFIVSLATPFSDCLLHCLVRARKYRLASVPALGFDKRLRKTFTRSPQAGPWEITLPWVAVMVVQIAAAVPVRDDRGPGFACAKAVAKSTCHGVGISVTARTPNVFERSSAGRRPSGKPGGAWMKRSKPSTPRRNGSAVSAPHLRHKHQILLPLRRRVVTQQKFFANSFVRPAGVL